MEDKIKYIYDIHTISKDHGELYLWYGEKGEECIVFDCEQLYRDLAGIIHFVSEGNDEMQKHHKERLIEELNKIKDNGNSK